MNINMFMEQGISLAVDTALKFYRAGFASLGSKAGRKFVMNLIPALKNNAEIRESYEKKGVHIPPYLIASIASQCNLRCAGCYARAGGACSSKAAAEELDAGQWERVFSEAAELGISLILLAGGEPLIRKDVVEAASRFHNIVFPVFTNGTMIDGSYLSLFDMHRNLIPVISIEGSEEETDHRRGAGISAKIDEVTKRLSERRILFGVSITITNRNIQEVTQTEFLRKLRKRGCGLAFFVEYVPAESGTEGLVLSETEAKELNVQITRLRKRFKNMIIVSFPGDEEEMGGCLAAGRGFFHINPTGGAEPCPFSPFSKYNLKNSSLLEVLQSEYFEKLRELEMNAGIHKGGCTLFELKDQVEKLAAQ